MENLLFPIAAEGPPVEIPRPDKSLHESNYKQTYAYLRKLLQATLGARPGYNNPARKPRWWNNEVEWSNKISRQMLTHAERLLVIRSCLTAHGIEVDVPERPPVSKFYPRRRNIIVNDVGDHDDDDDDDGDRDSDATEGVAAANISDDDGHSAP